MKVSKPLTTVDPNKPKIIRQINMAGTLFDICAAKDWDANDPEHKDYVANRTHFKENVKYVSEQDPYTKTYQQESGCAYRITDQKPEGVSHEFLNTYSKLGGLQTLDKWQIDAPWFVPGKRYNLTLTTYAQDGSSKVVYSDTNLLPANANLDSLLEGAYAGTYSFIGEDSIIIYYYPPNREFWIEGERYGVREGSSIYKSVYPISEVNNFTVEPVFDELYQDTVTRLDAAYIPIDNDTIRRSADGKLFVNDVFANDFFVSAPFGKYPAQTWVSAANKSTKEVLMEAFAERLQPDQKPKAPEIEFTATSNKSSYEIGETAIVNWEVRLNPSTYTYGTVSKHKAPNNKDDSNIWANQVAIWGFDEKESSIATFKHLRSDKGKTASEAEPLVLMAQSALDEYIKNITAAGGVVEENIDEDSNPALVLNRPTDIKYADSNGDKEYALVAYGTIEIPITEEGSYGTAHVAVKYTRDDTDPSADVTTEEPSCPPVKIGVKSDSEITRMDYDAKKTAGSVEGYYRWFWRYFDSDSNHVFGTIDSNTFRGDNDNNIAKCKLNGFPASITTDKMKYLYFAAPEGSAKRVNYTGPASFTLKNSDTGAKPGAVKRLLDENNNPKLIPIKDAAGNEHNYEVFYLALDGADKQKNTYNITYSTT